MACRGTNLGRDRFALGDGQQPKQIVCHGPQGHIVHACDGSLGYVEAVARASGKAILGAASLDRLGGLNLDAVKLPILLRHHIVARKVLEGGKHIVPAPQQRAGDASHSDCTDLAGC